METNSGFADFYSSLNKNVFKYFVRNESYWVYGTDIAMVPGSQLHGDTARGIKLGSIDGVVRDCLLVRRVPVEEYVAMPNGSFRLGRHGHPSHLDDFAELCLDERAEPTLCAVVACEGRTEFAYTSAGRIHETVFVDDDLFSILYSLVSMYNCVEMLYCDKRLERIAMGWGISGVHVSSGPVGDSYATLDAASGNRASAVIGCHLQRTLPISSFTLPDICLIDRRDFDVPTFDCITTQGRRLLAQWLCCPSTRIAEITRRLDLSEAFSRLSVNLCDCSDLKRMALRIENGRITVAECVRLCQMIRHIPSFIGELEHCEKAYSGIIEEDFIQPLRSVEKVFRPLLEQALSSIDFSTGRMRPGLSERLQQLTNERVAICDRIEEEFRRVKKQLGRARCMGKVFKIPRTDYSEGLFAEQKYVVVSLLKSGVTFYTNGLGKERDLLSTVDTAITAEEARLFDSLRPALLSALNSLEIYNFIIALMDIHSAFGRKCTTPAYSRPRFSTGQYKVEGFFHPLLEHRQPILNDIAFASAAGADGPSGNDESTAGSINSLDLCGNLESQNTSLNAGGASLSTVRHARTTCVLTGPNMGGKSTILKALSMVSLYAQIGCYVPAKVAVLPIFDRIFMRIGARDHAVLGLSTFMVEMMDLAKILRTATPRSLILIDELGRGTASLDGLSLVRAVKEHLVRLGTYSVMATHFSELGDATTLNLKMAVAESILTYKLVHGSADSSFGVGVAAKAGFPKEVVEVAKRYLASDI